jgi:exosortase
VAIASELANESIPVGSSTETKNIRFTLLILGLIVPLVSIAPVLLLNARELWESMYFRFSPLAFLAGLGLLWGTCTKGNVGRTRSIISISLMVLGMLFAVWGMFIISYARVHLAGLLILTGGLLFAFGGTSWTRILAICSLFFVTLPLPLGMSMRVIHGLQFAAGAACNSLLEVISIPNVFEDNKLRIEGAQFSVLEVCRDAGSCFALLALALMWLVLWQRSLIVGILVSVSVFLISLLGDMLRILTIVFFHQRFGLDISEGAAGIFLGLCIFAISVLFVILADISIAALLAPVEIDHLHGNVLKTYDRLVSWPQVPEVSTPESWTIPDKLKWILGAPALVCLLLGFISAWVLVIRPPAGSRFLGMSQKELDLFPGRDAFPDPIGPFKNISFSAESRPTVGFLGKHSRTWLFMGRDTQVIASLEFPISGWASPTAYYELLGWETQNMRLDDRIGEVPWTIEEMTLRNRFGITANAWSALFDEEGKPVKRESESGESSVTLLSKLRQSSVGNSEPAHFRVRMFLESGRKLQDVEIEQYRTLFVALFNQLRQNTSHSLRQSQ